MINTASHARSGRAGRAGRLAAAALAAFVLCVVPGCDTIGADIDDAFSQMFPPTPSEAVAWASDPDPDLRRRGLLLLANASFGGEPVYVALYRDFATNEPNPLVKAAAIRGLARHGEVADARLIAVQLEDDNRQVRWESARGLQRIHDPEVVPALLTRLQDEREDVQVRVAACTALGQYGSDRSFQGLVSALDAPDLAVNLAASTALSGMTGQQHGIDPGAWLDWYRTEGEGPELLAAAAEFRYPTYARELGWLEQLAFWSRPVREFPGPPLGLDSAGRRSTYDDGNAIGPVDEG